MKVNFFSDGSIYGIEEKINSFLKENSGIKFVKICQSESDKYITISIWYIDNAH